MENKNKLKVFGILNAIFMYVTYPMFRAILAFGGYFESPEWVIAFILAYAVHIAVNIKVVSLIKPDGDGLKEWLYITIGMVTGSLGSLVVLLIAGAFNTPWKYPYIGTRIPYNLIKSVVDTAYFFVSIVYILFVYEFGKKIYMRKKSKKDLTEEA